MRVCLVAIGSRGDVAPFLGLGRRVAAAGHDVTVASHEPFRPMVEAAGLGFRLVPGDLAPIIAVPSSDARPSPMFMSRRIGELSAYLRTAALSAVDVIAGHDVVVVTGTAPFAYDIAEGLGVPSLGAFLQPFAPSAAYPPVLLNATRSFGGPLNRLLGTVMPSAVFPYTRATAAVRERMGLPRRGVAATRRRQDAQRWPVFHGFSPAVLARPRDWRPGLEVSGYWWPDDDQTWQPTQGLLEFLDAGAAPVVITFGSMAAGAGRWLADAVSGAVARTGVRAIVQTGWAELAVAEQENVFAVGEVPHSWLFPRAAAVVHHGGAGTSGAVFRAGVPAVVTPIYADQPLWAGRAHALGVGPKPIPFTTLDADSLATGILQAVRDPARRDAARRVAALIDGEDGPAAVIAHLEKL